MSQSGRVKRTVETVEFTGPAGRIEGLLTIPEGARGAAVMCHPHPLFGGTMNNNVCFHGALALAESGRATLRFNFRGVGRSEGTYDEGRGEQDDLRAALRWLIERTGDEAPIIGGFSFGSRVALAVASTWTDPRPPAAVVAVGIAPRYLDLASLPVCPVPTLVVQGDADEYGPLEDVRPLVSRWGAELRVVEGAGHFFVGRLDELRAVVGSSILISPIAAAPRYEI
ncbi:MAG: hypothetical protein AMXMBFR64_13050 [Myxococcales bacterium]